MATVKEVNLKIDGIRYLLQMGQHLEISNEGALENLGSTGDKAIIVDILIPDDEPYSCGNTYICLEKEEEHESWQDGVYAEFLAVDVVYWFLVQKSGPMIVGQDYKFRKRNLKGMKCKILAPIGDKDVVIEMEKNIGGSSGDGIGKKGHCILIRRKFLTCSSKEKNKEK